MWYLARDIIGKVAVKMTTVRVSVLHISNIKASQRSSDLPAVWGQQEVIRATNQIHPAAVVNLAFQ